MADGSALSRAARGAAEAGVLVEVETAPPTKLPLEETAFDLATIDDTAGVLSAMSAADRERAIREVVRILRPGGRLVVIGRGAPTGIAAWFRKAPDGAVVDIESELQAGGFKAVRTLADREGLLFIEGIKPR
jgi:ubiquinone/menaquinone biosynthesis C-methylase UbiE